MSVTVAILAKDKAHCLPLYLECLLAQTYPKKETYLYIRTNDNTDSTEAVLSEWLARYGSLYKEIYFDSSSLQPLLKQYKPHQWNQERFRILGRIRQDSVEWAIHRGSHYFVADCDNFIHPETIQALVKTNLPVVGPFLITDRTMYSNFHHHVNHRGYFVKNPEYEAIYNRTILGLIEVAVIHCTYLIRCDVLDRVSYLDDGSGRHEYVIFSDNLRKNKIKQYLDNRAIYGYITFADNNDDLEKESWIKEKL